MTNTVRLFALVTLTLLVGCEAFGEAMTAHTDVVARAAGHELTIDEAASLLAERPRVPARPNVVEAISNLWVNYTLLAETATRDSTLRAIDVSPQIQPLIERQMVMALRDSVIDVDTTLTEEELRAIYQERQPGLEVRARHILLRVPSDATPAERDSVRALAEELRARAVGDAEFAALAREYSDDPGTAEQGGMLGWFGRGEMVQPFEEAAFSLEPGEISEVVRTPFGYHIIKVVDRRLRPFQLAAPRLRRQVLRERRRQATQQFLEQLTQPLDIRVREDAYDVVRELARAPERELSGRAAERELVVYEGGALTAGEFVELIRRFPANARARLAAAGDDQIQALLKGIARNRILLAEARERGLAPSEAVRDSLAASARQQLRTLIRAAGFSDIEPQGNETMMQAVSRNVLGLLRGIINGRHDLVRVARSARSLRDAYDAEIFKSTFPTVISRIESNRAAAEPATPPAAGAGAETSADPAGAARP